MDNWDKISGNLVKAELMRRGINYEQLQEKLEAIGVSETANSISLKLNRGKFSFAFFLQIMTAIDAKVFRLKDE